MTSGFEYIKQTYQLQLMPFLKRTLWVHGGKEGVYSLDYDGKDFRCTWHDQYERFCRLANAIRALGMDSGEKVGCLAWNNHRSGELSFTVPLMGLVFHPINVRYGREHLVHTINKSRDKIIFVDEDVIPLLEEISDNLETVRSYVVMTASDRLPKTKFSPVYSYDEILAHASNMYTFPDDIPENVLSVLCYTGGTTGLPKGVGWSPRSIILSCMAQSGVDQDDIGEEDTVLIPTNLFHANAQNFGWATLISGGKIVWPGSHPSLATILSLIEKEKVTYLLGASTLLGLLIQECEKGDYDLSSLRKVRSGATAPTQAVMEWLNKNGIKFSMAYGMAETPTNLAKVVSGRKHMQGWSKEIYIEKATQQGYPIPGLEVRVVNTETGQDVSWNGKDIGEVIARGWGIIEEYYCEPDTNRDLFKDGWLHTGDLAVIEEDGYIRLVDRMKDIIKSGGEWISSVDLENAIMDNVAVRQAVVFGIPDPKWEERPVAAVILKDHYRTVTTKDDIRKPLLSRFPSWWVPDQVIFVDELPVTGTMKVMKMVLRERWREGKLSRNAG
jgi:fatty-acyl-CoA synthase